MFVVPLVIVWAVVNTVTWVYVCSSAGGCVGRRQYRGLDVCL